MKHTEKACLPGLTLNEIADLVSGLNWPSYKAEQIYTWLYKKWASDFDQMTNLSTKERRFLAENFNLSPLSLKEKQVSKDKTIKYLWKLKDGNFVESVRMFLEDHDSYTACISSQVGCAVGCPFCATGKLGFKRNLNASEIVDQILSIQRDTNERINNIVFMGQGEPLLNYDELIKSISLIRQCIGIGARHITISTSGIVPQIKRLADEKLQATLAVSLHAPDQKTREILVPISKKYKMDELMKSLYYYYDKTKRRITFEYVMLEDINDQIEKAKELGVLIKDLHCHVNLIPYNPIDHSLLGKTPNFSFSRPSNKKINLFKETLEKASHKKVTTRKERGVDVAAACGQLANKAVDC